MAAMDFKKAYKDLYLPKTSPMELEVPPMTFIMIDGRGDPNAEEGEYARALSLLYGLCYTIKMSKLGKTVPDGYYDYVMPPLEGFWEMSNGQPGVDYKNKAGFSWTALIRQPEFVTPDVFAWACGEVAKKKGLNPAPARLQTLGEGLCVQCMHLGAFDEEPATVAKIEAYIEERGLLNDISAARRHHEIYLNDPRKTQREKCKTVLRVPVRRA